MSGHLLGRARAIRRLGLFTRELMGQARMASAGTRTAERLHALSRGFMSSSKVGTFPALIQLSYL